MKIYILKNEDSHRLLPFMSEQRLEKINGISNEKVKSEKICAYALLRYALFMEYGIDEAPLFSYGEREKPYLGNIPDVFFSLSHFSFSFFVFTWHSFCYAFLIDLSGQQHTPVVPRHMQRSGSLQTFLNEHFHLFRVSYTALSLMRCSIPLYDPFPKIAQFREKFLRSCLYSRVAQCHATE